MTTLNEKKLKGEILNLTLKNIILIGTISAGLFGTAGAMIATIILKAN